MIDIIRSPLRDMLMMKSNTSIQNVILDINVLSISHETFS